MVGVALLPTEGVIGAGHVLDACAGRMLEACAEVDALDATSVLANNLLEADRLAHRTVGLAAFSGRIILRCSPVSWLMPPSDKSSLSESSEEAQEGGCASMVQCTYVGGAFLFFFS